VRRFLLDQLHVFLQLLIDALFLLRSRRRFDRRGLSGRSRWYYRLDFCRRGLGHRLWQLFADTCDVRDGSILNTGNTDVRFLFGGCVGIMERRFRIDGRVGLTGFEFDGFLLLLNSKRQRHVLERIRFGLFRRRLDGACRTVESLNCAPGLKELVLARPAWWPIRTRKTHLRQDSTAATVRWYGNDE
jgi:hypothetical protein